MKNDQWFQPGDKVMEVMTDAEVMAALPHARLAEEAPTKPGVVYCVERFEDFPWGNGVILVGIEPNLPIYQRWILAMYFRKVDEIKLCVRAAKLAGDTLKPSEHEPQPA